MDEEIKETCLTADVLTYGDNPPSIGTHGGAVGNDPDAWRNDYTNAPIDYLHGGGSKKKKGKKSKTKPIPIFRRTFIETIGETKTQDDDCACMLEVKDIEQYNLLQDHLTQMGYKCFPIP